MFSYFIFNYSIHRAIATLRPPCGETPDRDSNPGRTNLVAGTLTSRPPHEVCDVVNSVIEPGLKYMPLIKFIPHVTLKFVIELLADFYSLS